MGCTKVVMILRGRRFPYWRSMKIDLLYFDGCPSWKDALVNLKAALAAEGLEADIQLVNVADDEEASRLKFLGSPSFQINGVDFCPEERQSYNLSCRVYPSPQGMNGAPTIELLREKLRPAP
jgi:hypothetical protein